MNTPIVVETPTCPRCGEGGTLVVDSDGYADWRAGTLIQQALPELTNAQREQLKTGIHPDCWTAIFAEPDETVTDGESTAAIWTFG